jgi:hypothetical protein
MTEPTAGRVRLRYQDIEAPQPDANLFPLCGCVRLCLTCASGCISQCVARAEDMQCQQRMHHQGDHYAEGVSTDGRWVRATWGRGAEAAHAGEGVGEC